MKYALVLVNIKGLGVKTFSYLIPEEMQNVIQVGQAVLVPFGRQGLINAFVVGFSDYVPDGIRVKRINRILDETPLFSLKYLKPKTAAITLKLSASSLQQQISRGPSTMQHS